LENDELNKSFHSVAFPKKFLATMNLQTDKKGMTSNDWIKRWENKTKIIRWQLNEVHPFIIKHAPSSKTHTRVLVPLAGKTVDLLWLLEKGFQVDHFSKNIESSYMSFTIGNWNRM